MFPEQLKKILRLIKKTRDRVVIFDASAPDESFVVMDLDNYTELAVTEEKTLPRSESPVPETVKNAANSELSPKKELKTNLTEEDLTDKINREISVWKNGENSPYLAEESKSRPGWKIPPQVKDKAQEVKE